MITDILTNQQSDTSTNPDVSAHKTAQIIKLNFLSHSPCDRKFVIPTQAYSRRSLSWLLLTVVVIFYVYC